MFRRNTLLEFEKTPKKGSKIENIELFSLLKYFFAAKLQLNSDELLKIKLNLT